MQIKMDKQMEQQKFPVKSHQMNIFHQKQLGIVMIMTRILTQGKQRYVMGKTTTATDKQTKVMFVAMPLLSLKLSVGVY